MKKKLHNFFSWVGTSNQKQRLNLRKRRLSFEECEGRILLAADAFEIDNTAAAASPISTDGAWQSHSIHADNDVDWVRFTLAARSDVTINTQGVRGGDTEVYLYGPNDTNRSVAFDDYHGSGRYSKIERTGSNALEPGTYFVKTIEDGQNRTISQYSINVMASPSAPVVPPNTGDAFENDNTAAAASPISTDGAWQSHSIHTDNDVDWVRFTLADRSDVTINTQGVRGGDTEVYLYGPNDTNRSVAFDDYHGSGRYSKIERTGSKALEPGTYFVKTIEDGQNRTISQYSINVMASPSAPVVPPNTGDAFENDNTAAAASLIATDGTWQSHSIHTDNDVDWVRFTLAARSDVTINTQGVRGGDTEVYLYGPNDTNRSVAFDDYHGSGRYSKIERTGSNALEPGTYFVKTIEDGQNRTISQYSINVMASPSAPVVPPNTGDAFENDNTAAAASLIATDGTWQSHSIHTDNDVDWVRFTLAARSDVTINTQGVRGGDTEVYLYGPNDTNRSVAFDDYHGSGRYSKIERTGSNALEPGTYFVKTIEDGQNRTISQYSINVMASPSAPVVPPNTGDAFENDNTAAAASLIATDGTWQSHSIHTDNDVDWVRFTLAARSDVTINTQGVRGGDTEVYLYGPNDTNRSIAFDDYHGSGRYSKIERTGSNALEPGTYFVKTIEDGQNRTISQYSINVMAMRLS